MGVYEGKNFPFLHLSKTLPDPAFLLSYIVNVKRMHTFKFAGWCDA